jgi:hypothetical protein
MLRRGSRTPRRRCRRPASTACRIRASTACRRAPAEVRGPTSSSGGTGCRRPRMAQTQSACRRKAPSQPDVAPTVLAAAGGVPGAAGSRSVSGRRPCAPEEGGERPKGCPFSRNAAGRQAGRQTDRRTNGRTDRHTLTCTTCMYLYNVNTIHYVLLFP